MMEEVDIARLRALVERLEATPDIEEACEVVANEVIETGGAWVVPPEMRDITPVAIQLHGVHVIGRNRQGALRRLVQGLRARLAREAA